MAIIKKQSILLFCTSTFFLSGLISLDILNEQSVFAKEPAPILDPLNPNEEISPIDREPDPELPEIHSEPVEVPKEVKPVIEKTHEIKMEPTWQGTFRPYKRRTFIDKDFFNEITTEQPIKSSGGSDKENELSKICYALSGKLLVGRKGKNTY